MVANPTTDHYSTSDLVIAAVLMHHGLRISFVKKGTRAEFVFEDRTQKREQLLTDLMNRKLTVEPMRFMGEVRQLKAMTH